MRACGAVVSAVDTLFPCVAHRSFPVVGSFSAYRLFGQPYARRLKNRMNLGKCDHLDGLLQPLLIRQPQRANVPSSCAEPPEVFWSRRTEYVRAQGLKGQILYGICEQAALSLPNSFVSSGKGPAQRHGFPRSRSLRHLGAHVPASDAPGDHSRCEGLLPPPESTQLTAPLHSPRPLPRLAQAIAFVSPLSSLRTLPRGIQRRRIPLWRAADPRPNHNRQNGGQRARLLPRPLAPPRPR